MNEPCYYRVSVKALVFDKQGRILLCRENSGDWDLLGGGIDHDEDPIDCLRREIKEEAGVEINKISEHPVYFLTFYTEKDSNKYYKANVIYEVELNNINFTPTEECQEIKFFTPEDAKKLKLYPNVQKLLKILTD